MPTRAFPRSEWRRYCERVSRAITGRPAELDVASLRLGAHVKVHWSPFLGIVFDARGDVLEIALDGVGHSIVAPQEIRVEETERGLVAMDVIAADDAVETLRFREPLAL